MQREKSEKQLERTVEKPFFLKELDMEIPSPPQKKTSFSKISRTRNILLHLFMIFKSMPDQNLRCKTSYLTCLIQKYI